MNQLLYSEKTVNPIKIIAIVFFAIIIIAIVALIILSSRLNGKILSNVYVGDIEVGLCTKQDAERVLQEGLGNSNAEGLNLVYGNKTRKITADEIEFTTTKPVSELVEDAYNYGRNGNVFSNTATKNPPVF